MNDPGEGFEEDWALLRRLPSNADPMGMIMLQIRRPGALIINGNRPKIQLFLDEVTVDESTLMLKGIWVQDWGDWTLWAGSREGVFQYLPSIKDALLSQGCQALNITGELKRLCDEWRGYPDDPGYTDILEWLYNDRQCWNFWLLLVHLGVRTHITFVINATKVYDWELIEQWVRWMDGATHLTLVLCCLGNEDFSSYPGLLATPMFGL